MARHTRVGPPASVAGSVREAVVGHIMDAHEEVETLYRLDRDAGFDPEAPADLGARDFAAARIASGADMLAVLWWSAWLESAQDDGRDGAGR